MKNLTNGFIGDSVSPLNSTQFVFFGAEQMNTLNENVDGESNDEETSYEESLAKYKGFNKKLEKIKEDEKADRENEELVDTDEAYEENIVLIGDKEYDINTTTIIKLEKDDDISYESLAKLVNLKFLDLRENNTIQEIPDTLVNLKMLSVDQNRTVEIPENIREILNKNKEEAILKRY